MCGCQPVGINVGAQEDQCLGQGGCKGSGSWRWELSTQGCRRVQNTTADMGWCSPLTTPLQIPSLNLWGVPYPKAHVLPKAQWFRVHWRQQRPPQFFPKSLPYSVIISSAHKFHISIWREKSTSKSSDYSWPCLSVNSLEEPPALCWGVLQAGGVCSSWFVPALVLSLCEMKLRRA